MTIPQRPARRQRAPAAPIELELRDPPLTKTAQIRLAGNSVPPCLAEHVVRANVGADAESEVA